MFMYGFSCLRFLSRFSKTGLGIVPFGGTRELHTYTFKQPILAANPGCSRLSGGFFRRAQILSDESAVSYPRATPTQSPKRHRERVSSRRSPLKGGCSQDWLPHRSPAPVLQ